MAKSFILDLSVVNSVTDSLPRLKAAVSWGCEVTEFIMIEGLTFITS